MGRVWGGRSGNGLEVESVPAARDRCRGLTLTLQGGCRGCGDSKVYQTCGLRRADYDGSKEEQDGDAVSVNGSVKYAYTWH